MRYYIQDDLEKLRAMAIEYPAVSVNLSHPSLVLFDRLYTGEHKSLIDLGEAPECGADAVNALRNRLAEYRQYARVENEFGDADTMDMVRNFIERSFAIVRDNQGALTTIGPISSIPTTKTPATTIEEETK